MKKAIYILCIMLFCFKIYPFVYDNDFREDDNRLYLGINKYLFSPQSIDIDFLFFYDYIGGISKDGAFYVDTEIKLSKLFNFGLSTQFRTKKYFFKSVIFFWNLQLPKFFSFRLDYILNSYIEYFILQHNFFISTRFELKIKKRADFNFFTGINFRFVDLNMHDTNYKYRNGWLFEAIISWKLSLLIHVTKIYSVGLEIGNEHCKNVVSFAYIQYELMNYFFLPYNLRLFTSFGIGYSGAFSLAGFINRIWGGVGIAYKIKFR